MNQPTFADLEYECKKRKTRRELFLERMDGLIPWGQLESRIRPYYPEAGIRMSCRRCFAYTACSCSTT
jgi:IS5 family transposase